MAEPDIGDLAKRVAELETQLAAMRAERRPKDWRSMVGCLEDNEFNRSWMEETLAIRERSRREAAEAFERGDEPE